MKKRFLIILVVMFSWCNVGFADVLKFNCKGLGKNKNEIVDWVYSLDTGTKTLGMEWKMKGSKKIWSETFDIRVIYIQKLYTDLIMVEILLIK